MYNRKSEKESFKRAQNGKIEYVAGSVLSLFVDGTAKFIQW
jgi:hypothetical protein